MTQSTITSGRIGGGSLVSRTVGVAGCLAVGAIHIIDQGGVPGSKEPKYVTVLYYVLEAASAIAVVLLQY
jgi:hypothetical protein